MGMYTMTRSPLLTPRFFNVSPYFGQTLGGGKVVDTATDFCTALLEEAHVALVTGEALASTVSEVRSRLSFLADRRPSVYRDLERA